MSPDSKLGTEAELEAHVRALIEAAGPSAASLLDLTLHAQGSYPTEVRRLAREVVAVRPELLRPESLGFRPIRPELLAARSVLPIPHPLDFEWRYAASGWDRLTQEISQHATNGGRDVALFGTSGFAEVLPDLMPGARVTLFERRGEACNALAGRDGLSVEHGDVAITTTTIGRRFDVVVADPPWYPALIELFVQAAARVLGRDGLLALCLPGRATRPGIPAELAHLVDIAGAVGFALELHDEAAVVYESPPFELSALAAADLTGFDPHWRRADLLRFRKTSARSAVARSGPDIAGPDASWQEVSIGRARIRVDLRTPVTATSKLESIVAGDVLDSVSSRDTRRASATIWTTTNRVFRTDAPGDLMAALQRAAAGQTIDREWSDPVARLVDGELDRLRQLDIE
jgi:hypothetical protein